MASLGILLPKDVAHSPKPPVLFLAPVIKAAKPQAIIQVDVTAAAFSLGCWQMALALHNPHCPQGPRTAVRVSAYWRL